jgi:hypothetical protein
MTPSLPDFWQSCGYRLLAQDGAGQLVVTDDFLRYLLMRPEVVPIESSCAAEVALHTQLLDAPRLAVAATELSVIKDADAAENYAVWLRFRARLLAAPTLEAAYMALFQGGDVDVPPVLVQQITHILLRHVLGDQRGNAPAAMEARAAEMLFRTQKISIQENGSVMAADDETVARQATEGSFGTLGELLKRGGIPLRSMELDVLSADSADAYWPRNEQFDLVVSLNRDQPALDALCRVLEKWIAHFMGVTVKIKTDREIIDEHWIWHVGLDAQASGILNDLYAGDEVDEARMRRLLCLFRLEFTNPADMLSEVAGRPVYLAMAMDVQNRLKLKPQNLLLNLPLARRS